MLAAGSYSHYAVQHVLISSTLIAQIFGIAPSVYDPERPLASQLAELLVSLIIRVHGGDVGVSQTEIAEHLGWSRKTVQGRLDRLLKRGVIIRVARDSYVCDPQWIIDHVDERVLDQVYDWFAAATGAMKELRVLHNRKT